MKKKMLFMAAIAGLVSVGSCVKDDVSGSVEAVRQAKANELNGLANQANANAALLNAQAALENAKQSAEVALAQANAAFRQAQVENQQLLNAAQALTNKLAEDQYEAQLESVISGFQATTALNNQNIQTRLNALKDAIKTGSTKEYEFLQNLIGKYTTALTAYNNAQAAVITAKATYESALAGAELAEAANAVNIRLDEKLIKQYTAILEALEEMVSEEMDQEEMAAKAAVLEVKIDNLKAAFGNTEEVAALLAAGQELAKARKAFNTAYATTYGNANALIADAFGHTYTTPNSVYTYDTTTNTWKGNTTPVRIPAGAVYYNGPGAPGDPNDVTFRKVQIAPWGEYTDYYETTSATPLKITGDIPFADFESYAYRSTKTTVGLNTTVTIAATPTGAGQTFSQNSFTTNTFRVSERTKLEADNYFETLPETSKDALDVANKQVSEAQDLLGTPKDNATTKTKLAANQDANKKQVLTKYAELAKAKAEKETADANVEKYPGELKEAMTALYNVFDVSSWSMTVKADREKAINAIIALAKAVENVYGKAAYNKVPSNLTYDTDDYDKAVQYLFGNSSKSRTDLNSLALVKSLLTSTTLFTFTGSTPGTYNVDNLDAVAAANGGRETGAKSVQQIAAAAKTKYDNLNTEINGFVATAAGTYTNTVTGATVAYVAGDQVNGRTQDIADMLDHIVNKLQPDYNEAAGKQAAYKAAVAVKAETYDTAVEGLKTAIDAYKAAAAPVQALIDEIDDLNAEKTAYSTATPQNIEDKIAGYQKSLAERQKDLAQWKAANTTEALIATSQRNLANAEATLEAAEADLIAAIALIKQYEIDIDLFDFDEEPAEDPSEEPADDEPAGDEPAGDEPAGDEPAGDE